MAGIDLSSVSLRKYFGLCERGFDDILSIVLKFRVDRACFDGGAAGINFCAKVK